MIDSDLLDVLLTWDQTGQYEVTELNGEHPLDVTGDWMTTLLQTKAFHRIPPANIQAIFLRMQRINYRARDVVIKQGTEGDYFYVVVSGKCVVTRETPLNKEGIKLAELGPGDSFGEEALIAEAKRNATVTMITDGTLMRLGKHDFQTLLNEPLLQWVSYDKAKEIVARGGKWLDVRLPSEFQNFRIDDAVNIPLYFIRLKINALDKNTPYVVCCDTGRRSSAAAYILSERGFEAYVLKGGLAARNRRAPRELKCGSRSCRKCRACRRCRRFGRAPACGESSAGPPPRPPRTGRRIRISRPRATTSLRRCSRNTRASRSCSSSRCSRSRSTAGRYRTTDPPR